MPLDISILSDILHLEPEASGQGCQQPQLVLNVKHGDG